MKYDDHQKSNADEKKYQIKEGEWTYHDYAELPDDGQRYELNDGRLEFMSPAPSPRHQSFSAEIFLQLSYSCRLDYIILSSPVDVILSEKEVRQPDIVMVHRSRSSIITHRGIEGPPDLTIEILSPSSRSRDKLQKTNAYAKYGVPEYWIVDPANRMIEQYVLNNGKYYITGIYTEDDPVRSGRIVCVKFTLRDILKEIRDIPDLDN